MDWRLVVLLGVLCSLAVPSDMVDQSKFRTCAQSAFCTRCRAENSGLGYKMDPETLRVTTTTAEALLTSEKGVQFRLEVVSLRGVFRFRIREAFPLIPRFTPDEQVLLSKLEQVPLTLTHSDKSGFVLGSLGNSVSVQADPF
ncbi:unnamed protein product [Lepeophtheirus salmonis]|uniref:(salmon louse) hypothetical protein n=1 Tax=Lepeophtheirus salmonis TaxID=72036 RepID=A0A7R8HAS0_LEPSM|nr:unnamed protein product [Lepeophtheirus salmonis]CAF2970926.1 unnamed protein product [Lepeophtheirus salmonis]